MRNLENLQSEDFMICHDDRCMNLQQWADFINVPRDRLLERFRWRQEKQTGETLSYILRGNNIIKTCSNPLCHNLFMARNYKHVFCCGDCRTDCNYPLKGSRDDRVSCPGCRGNMMPNSTVCHKCNKPLQKLVRRILIHHAGNKCVKCGFRDNPYCFHFHHRDPSTKSFNIGSPYEITPEILNEVDKCDILCLTCHKNEHYPSPESTMAYFLPEG